MNEQNTGPDFGENSGNISETSQNSEAIKALEKRGLQNNIAKKLGELQGEIDTQAIEQIYAEEYPGENKTTEIAQVGEWLQEHKQNVLDLASFERSKLRESLSLTDNSLDSQTTASVVFQSLKTIGTFGKDLGLGIIEALKNPAAAMQYSMQQADGILSSEDLNYKIT